MSERQAIFSTHFLGDLSHWVQTDRKTTLHLLRIVGDTLPDPFRGIGKPEPLKGELSGCWSRRLTQEHRVVYEVKENQNLVRFLQARYHY